MSFDIDNLYKLLPAIHRIRDQGQGEPLKSLLTVIAEQIAALEEDLDQLYDDQFIETCAEWVVPYIGDLIGYRALYGVTSTVRSRRAEVANTISYRRGKGTAAVLERLARDVTGWKARVVEFFQLLECTQYMNHVRSGHNSMPHLRDWQTLEYMNTPFDSAARTVDVRRISVERGKYNIPNVGIFLWRLNAYPVTESPAVRLDDNRYFFHPLGMNTPLFNYPDDRPTFPAKPVDVPMPISRRVLDKDLSEYYGRSFSLKVNGADVPSDQVRVCDLSNLIDSSGNVIGWAHAPKDKIAIDPLLGRILLPEPKSSVVVSFHYGFSADIGGGQYDRKATLNSELRPVLPVRSPEHIQDALSSLSESCVVEIRDNSRYDETLTLDVKDYTVELRAEDEHRPTLVLGGDLSIAGNKGAELTINGLLIAGGTLKVKGKLGKLRLRHCTLVPGVSLSMNGKPEHPDQPSLVLESPGTVVEIDHCILGAIRAITENEVTIRDSIVDALGLESVAYSVPESIGPGSTLIVENSTVIGAVHALILELASNTIFLSPITAVRRQVGCVRFCYLPPTSRTPRRYRCQPENDTKVIRPAFTSLQYGDPGYCRLSKRCSAEISRGADDESEMGAFHQLYQPQRLTNLRIRLEEYLRFSLEAGIFFAS